MEPVSHTRVDTNARIRILSKTNSPATTAVKIEISGSCFFLCVCVNMKASVHFTIHALPSLQFFFHVSFVATFIVFMIPPTHQIIPTRMNETLCGKYIPFMLHDTHTNTFIYLHTQNRPFFLSSISCAFFSLPY